MKDRTEQAKNIATTVFYIIMTISLISFTCTYAFTDWDKVSENIAEGMENAAEVIKCEIKQGNFYFKGMCTEKEVIFEYLEYLNNKTSKECATEGVNNVN